MMLEIKDLHVKVEDKEILKGVNLSIGNGKDFRMNSVLPHTAFQTYT